jgi:hypothetical protein
MTDQGATERAEDRATLVNVSYLVNVAHRTGATFTYKEMAAVLRCYTAAVAEARAAPVPMILFCPACGTQHVDSDNPNWENPPHKTHRCESCEHLWRPAEIATEGVADLPLGTSDTRPAIRRQTEARAAAIEECVQWHEAQAAAAISGQLHRRCADALRALAAPAQSET